MANWSKLQITRRGVNLQQKVEAGKTKLNITRIKLGSGITVDDVSRLEDLVTAEQSLNIGERTAFDNYCRIIATVSNFGISHGYEIRELGVYASDPDMGEILYAYTYDDMPDYLPPNNGNIVISQEYAVNIANVGTGQVNITIDPYSLTTVRHVANAIDEHNNSLTAHQDFTGATSGTSGERGMVPEPPRGSEKHVLIGEGTWANISSLPAFINLSKETKITALLSENGYIKFSNGLIIQWGVSYGSKTVNFPIPFSSGAWAISTSLYTGSRTEGNYDDVIPGSKTKTGFQWTDNELNTTKNWIATGA